MSSTERRLTKWWEKPSAFGRHGVVVSAQGRNTPIECPKCNLDLVVYNGNYFCDSCDWALAHPARSQRDRGVCDQIGIDYR